MTTNKPNDKGIVPRKSLIVKIFGQCIPFTHCYHEIGNVELKIPHKHGIYFVEKDIETKVKCKCKCCKCGKIILKSYGKLFGFALTEW